MVLTPWSSSNSVQHWWNRRFLIDCPVCFGSGCRLSQMSQTPSELPLAVETSDSLEDSEVSAGI